MPLFIVFEGGEGAGKSTQARALYRRLSRMGILTVRTFEPGGTPLGNQLGKRLKWSRDIALPVELLLFAAARAQLVAEVIRPSLEQGAVVISDRFSDSTTAYQGYGRGLDMSLIEAANAIATQGLRPDLVILLDIPVEQGLARKSSERKDRFEQEALDFHQRVRQGYLEMAAQEPERWLVVDAALPQGEIERVIWQRVKPLLE